MARKPADHSEVRVSTSEEAETAVKQYLASLAEPRTRGRRARPKPDFDAATKGIVDPLAKLAAIKAERERVAQLTVGDAGEADFIRFGKVWAKIHAYRREDFAVLGVPKRVLDATFGVSDARSSTTVTATPKPAGPAARARARRTDPRSLAGAIEAKHPGSWVSVASVMEEAGGSPATVRKVLDRLSEDGTLTRPIPDPHHTGRGRAPKVWQRN